MVVCLITPNLECGMCHTLPAEDVYQVMQMGDTEHRNSLLGVCQQHSSQCHCHTPAYPPPTPSLSVTQVESLNLTCIITFSLDLHRHTFEGFLHSLLLWKGTLRSFLLLPAPPLLSLPFFLRRWLGVNSSGLPCCSACGGSPAACRPSSSASVGRALSLGCFNLFLLGHT